MQNENQKQDMRRTKCLTFSRVVGYLTPVQNWNDAKKAEYDQREFYSNDCACQK